LVLVAGVLKEIIIDINGVSVRRRGNSILTDLTLRIETGQSCAIIGPNGSGKSTLLALLAGYIWPTKGTVSIAGYLFGRVNLNEIRKIIGLIEPSRAPKFSEKMTARDIVATGLFGTVMLPINASITPGQLKSVDSEIDLIGLTSHATVPFGELSSGEQMKTLIARALVSQAKILLLDEPTVGLDIAARTTCMNTLDRLSQRADPPTIIVVSHHLDELPANVSQIVLLKDGKIFANGQARQVLTSEKLSKLYDCDIHVINTNDRFIATTNYGKQ
jgi:iron complex transport system ATP-binding protein